MDKVTGETFGPGVACNDEQSIVTSISLAYVFFVLFVFVAVPLLFSSGILAALSFSYRRDIAILVARMRLRTGEAIQILGRAKRSKAMQKLNKDLITRFHHMDTDGGGTIDREELEIFLHASRINTTQEELDRSIAIVDNDFDGELDFDEFRHLISVLAHSEARRRLTTERRKAFHGVSARLIDEKGTRMLCQRLVPGLTTEDLKGDIGSHLYFKGEVSY